MFTALLTNIPRTVFLAAAVLMLSLFIAVLISSQKQTDSASQVANSYDDFSLIPQNTFHVDDTVRGDLSTVNDETFPVSVQLMDVGASCVFLWS